MDVRTSLGAAQEIEPQIERRGAAQIIQLGQHHRARGGIEQHGQRAFVHLAGCRIADEVGRVGQIERQLARRAMADTHAQRFVVRHAGDEEMLLLVGSHSEHGIHRAERLRIRR